MIYEAKIYKILIINYLISHIDLINKKNPQKYTFSLGAAKVQIKINMSKNDFVNLFCKKDYTE